VDLLLDNNNNSNCTPAYSSASAMDMVLIMLCLQATALCGRLLAVEARVSGLQDIDWRSKALPGRAQALSHKSQCFLAHTCRGTWPAAKVTGRLPTLWSGTSGCLVL
jgi:hypothetical protein